MQMLGAKERMTTRRDFLRRAGLISAGIATGVAFGSTRSTAAPEARPNVLFVLTDDQPPQTVAMMERLKTRMQRDWTQTGYSDVPVCGPARVSLLTGKYSHNHEATTNGISWRVYRDRNYADDDLLSRVRRAGYRVGYFGKVINGYGSAGSSKWVHPAAHRWVALASGQSRMPYRVNINGTLRETKQKQTIFFSGYAERFVRNNAGRPWFCYLALTDPHVPHDPFKVYKHSHDGELWTSPGTQEDDLSDKSEWTRNLGMNRPEAWQANWEGTLEELEGTEDRVISLLDAVEETGQAENTIVIFSSDNGYMHGEHGGLFKKSLPYEESARVPFLLTIPGANLPESLLVNRLDITATILDAVTADATGIDGRSFYRAAHTAAWRKRLLSEHPGRGWRMMREDPYVYIRLPSEEEELYDIVADPFQTESLPMDAFGSLYSDLREKCAALANAGGDELRALEEA